MSRDSTSSVPSNVAYTVPTQILQPQVPESDLTSLLDDVSRTFTTSDQENSDADTSNPTSDAINIAASPSQDSSTSNVSVTSLPRSENSSTQNIDIIKQNMENSLFLDSFSSKHDGDFRLILQNPRGIKEFRDKDPEYLPTMQALRAGQADLMCFVETNVPWQRNDFLYDVAVANKSIWPTTTKTKGGFLQI